jgi:hypothetical protein
MQLPNTKIRSVVPANAGTGVANVVSAWSGATVDTTRSRMLVWGGGHTDYDGNEMYALDLSTLTIQRIVEPSPVVSQSSCNSALPDGLPAARHTYGGLAYIAHLDSFFATGGSLSTCGGGDKASWTYNFGTRQWAMKVASSPMQSFYGTIAAYDPATRKVYVKDQGALYAYSPDSNSYTKVADTGATDYHLAGALDTKRRKLVMLGRGVQIVDLATGQLTTMSTSNTPALATTDSPGVAYDPVADRIVAWSGGSNVYALNMDTGAWTQVNTGTGPTSAAQWTGTFGRWAYIPQYRVFALINSIDEDAWVFRLTN